MSTHGELHVVEHGAHFVQVGVDAHGAQCSHQVFGLLARLHALDGQDGVGRAGGQLLFVLVFQHAGRREVGRTVGLAVLAQAFACAVVLGHHRAHKVHVGWWVDFGLVLDLVAHQREHRPESLDRELGTGRLFEKVFVALGYDVHQAAGLVVELVHAHHAFFGFFFVLRAVGGQRLARRVVRAALHVVGGVVAVNLHAVNLTHLVGGEEHFVGNPACTNEAAQLLAAWVNDDGRRVGEVEHQAFAHDHFGLRHQVFEGQLQLFKLGAGLVDLALGAVLGQCLQVVQAHLDVVHACAHLGSALGLTLETQLDVAHAGGEHAAHQRLHLRLERRLGVLHEVMEQDFQGLADLVQAAALRADLLVLGQDHGHCLGDGLHALLRHLLHSLGLLDGLGLAVPNRAEHAPAGFGHRTRVLGVQGGRALLHVALGQVNHVLVVVPVLGVVAVERQVHVGLHPVKRLFVR